MCVVTSVQIHCIHVLKYSNFRMLESIVGMFECFNALLFLHVVVLFILKMLVAGKRKHQALKDLQKGESNKDAAANYNVPKNTLSTWVKNKEKLFYALK